MVKQGHFFNFLNGQKWSQTVSNGPIWPQILLATHLVPFATFIIRFWPFLSIWIAKITIAL